jgi:hypothetical protein
MNSSPHSPDSNLTVGDAAPAAVRYARLYAGAFTAMYGLCILVGILEVVVAAAGWSTPRKIAETYIRGGARVVVGLPLMIVCARAFVGVRTRTKRMWKQHQAASRHEVRVRASQGEWRLTVRRWARRAAGSSEISSVLMTPPLIDVRRCCIATVALETNTALPRKLGCWLL